ncbi:PhnD/SsuA/transferrin family substrate-binding protein [Pseudoalteromonas sp. SS15]|uniref:PhnD/SsuA/transferrin family substrate-binding protein n=1 Tax=Pseudoalteromonas sp. SS15 TaxID=3139393 RepID=UPI003BAA63EF
MFLSVITSTWLVWLLSQLVITDTSIHLVPIQQHKFQCQTSSSENQAVFRVKVPTKQLAEQILPALCQNSVLKRQFGHVEVFWGGSLAEQIEFFGKGIADLILSKDSIMQALRADATHNYTPIIGYSSYSAFFISNKEKPKLEKAYFLDKRIGLLDHPTSRSGHILPKKAFKQLDLDIKNLDITYVSSHTALREKLANNEVDIIASYWNDKTDDEKFSHNYIIPIGDNITGSRWYLKLTENNTDLACAVQTITTQIAQSVGSAYFESLEKFWQCDLSPYKFIGEK